MKPKTKKSTLRFANYPKDYAGLVALLPPRTIHDAADLANVSEIVFEMAGHNLTPDQADYHELLSNLMLEWEDKRPVKWPSSRM